MSNSSRLDANQVLKEVFDDSADALRVLTSGGLVSESYDEIELTYVAAGNGAGEVETVTYKNAGSTIAVLTLSYDGSNRLIQVIRS